MPPAERQALLSLLVLAVVGQGVRYLLTRPGEPPGQVQLLATLPPASPSAQRDSSMAQGRPLRPGETVDVDRAALTELTRLPKVGPRLAKTILADRARNGAFGSLAGLDRVPGIGSGLLQTLERHVVFSGAEQLPALRPRAPASPLNLNTATLQQLDSLPGIGAAKAAAILQYRQEHGPFTEVAQLGQVPGFGPAAVAKLRERLVAP